MVFGGTLRCPVFSTERVGDKTQYDEEDKEGQKGLLHKSLLTQLLG
jgi:hypothetical protein